MANVLYPLAKQAFLSGEIDLADDTIKAALIDTGVYTYSAAHDDFWTDVSAGMVGDPVTLGTKSVSNGVFDAADCTFSAVSGNTVEAIVIFKEASPAAAQPIAYIDTATGLPATPSGADIVTAWDNGANKIFAL